jgi:hypothetical protein
MNPTEVSTKKNFIIPGLVVFVILVIVAGGFIFFEYQKNHSKNSSKAGQTVSVVEQIGKLIELPTGEEPTVATVSDKTKLADQPFFDKAINGDKVLIYQKAKKAILYRPSTNKIINVATIDLGVSPTPASSPISSPITSASISPSASPKSSPVISKTYTVVIYNGTTVSGLGSKTKTTLESKVSNVNVTGVHDAVKSTYTKTVVVDLTGQSSVEASTIAKALNGSVGPLPAGEVKPSSTDIVIIVGQ